MDSSKEEGNDASVRSSGGEGGMKELLEDVVGCRWFSEETGWREALAVRTSCALAFHDVTDLRSSHCSCLIEWVGL